MTSKTLACDGCRNGKDLPFSIVMAFQPIVDMVEHRVWGYEALVRGSNGEGAAAILAQVTDGDRYRFDQLCRVTAIETAGQLFDDPRTKLSINFMPNAVYEPAACIRTSLAAAERVGFARDRLMFEFTEDERVMNHGHLRHIVEEYRRFGFTTAMDDFGAGYAGLTLLADFQPDIIKLDMALVRNVHLSAARQTILAGLVFIARTLGITILAEGVESREEMSVLLAAGIRLFQGYLFAKPTIGHLPIVSSGLLDPDAKWGESRKTA